MWTLDELKQCENLIKSRVSKDDVDFSYNNVGGVGREAFDKRWLSFEIVNEGKSEKRR